MSEVIQTDTNTSSKERFFPQFVPANPIGMRGAHWRVTDRTSDSRVATCFDIDNARMVSDALNAYLTHATRAGCPYCTEAYRIWETNATVDSVRVMNQMRDAVAVGMFRPSTQETKAGQAASQLLELLPDLQRAHIALCSGISTDETIEARQILTRVILTLCTSKLNSPEASQL